jgi:hypothetical protein
MDPGWVKKSRSGMNILDHISESLETILWVTIILKYFDADPLRSWIREKHTGSATLVLWTI